MMKNVFLFFLTLICFSSCSYGQKVAPGMTINICERESRKIFIALSAIRNFYVDTVNICQLTNDAIITLLEKLDPHSEYLIPEEVKELTEPLQGKFDGIGIQFNMLTDTLYVIQVIPGGPSEKVGIMAGDRIIRVNDTLIAGVKMKNNSVISHLRGPKGTTVEVKVLRGSNPNLMSFKIVRGTIPVCSLDASYMLNMETGYIKLNRFAETTYDEFIKAIHGLQDQGMKNLILDLQDNGGGYLNAAIVLANEFLKKGNLIVYTEGIHQRREDALATTTGSFMDGKLVVLINEFSASASEIVAGALQDWDRAVVVGRRSFGKGLVQRPILMSDGSMIKLTTARYYTPTGRSIQKPYENGKGYYYSQDLIKRYNRGEMLSADSIHFPDSLKYNTLINRRIVYGGGGIMPDYFVPIDTTYYTEEHRSLLASSVLSKFVMSYIDKNRTHLYERYKDIDIFRAKFDVTKQMLSEVLELFKKENLELTEQMSEMSGKQQTLVHITGDDFKQFERSESLIKLQIKALIARDLWNMNEYYQIINDENDALKKALEIIENTGDYNKLLGK